MEFKLQYGCDYRLTLDVSLPVLAVVDRILTDWEIWMGLKPKPPSPIVGVQVIPDPPKQA